MKNLLKVFLVSGTVLSVLSQSVLAATLLHKYTFDTDASDSIGNADGTLIGGASIAGGQLVLDGVDDFVQFDEMLVPTSGSYSVFLSARQDSVQTGTFVELISQGLSSGPGFYFGHTRTRNIRISDVFPNTSVLFPDDGLFHHYVITVDAVAQSTQLYIDGALALALGSNISTTTLGDNTRFGRQFDPFAEFFHGALDKVAIYDGALTAQEVEDLHNSKTSTPEPSTILGLGTLALAGGTLLRRRK